MRIIALGGGHLGSREFAYGRKILWDFWHKGKVVNSWRGWIYVHMYTFCEVCAIRCKNKTKQNNSPLLLALLPLYYHGHCVWKWAKE